MISKSKRPLAAIVGASAAAALLVLTPKFEGTVNTTYQDIGGVLTYCTGATEDAQWGKTYSKEQCAAQLDSDLARHAEGVMRCIKVPLTEGQKIAFVDVAFNIGIGNFCSSSMLRKANSGDMLGACDALLMWDKVNGKSVRGLTLRRQAERALCIGDKIV